MKLKSFLLVMLKIFCLKLLKIFFNFREGLVIIRKESKYGPPKEAMYDTTVWAEAGLQFDEWLKSFRSDNPVKKHMLGDMYFISSVWERNGMRYSGIHMFYGNSDIFHSLV